MDLLGLLYRESHHLSLALYMEGMLLPLLPLLDQQLTQPYLLVQYQSFLYLKKKAIKVLMLPLVLCLLH